MKFEVDSQTLKDLEIFDTVKDGMSVFSLFNFTQCQGGRRVLYEFLSSPLTNLEKITERTDTTSFFQKHLPEGLNIDKDSLDFAEYYTRHGDYPTRIPTWFTAFERMIMDRISTNTEYYLVKKGVGATVSLLKAIHLFVKKMETLAGQYDVPHLIKKHNDTALAIFSKPEFAKALTMKRIKAYDTSQFDYIFRFTHKRDILFFLDLIYEYDAYFSIAKAAEKYGLSYTEMLPADANMLEVEGLYHPFVERAVANDMKYEKPSNLLFISGPNMAGKSTFLKALGLSAYLAHVGFPVPAKKMKMSILSGLCTTINISDDLSSGYSHFYAEVMRIKDVACKLKTHKNMLVIFDELFRGTNVKDAYDGTLAVVNAFTNIKSSFFLVSSHIVEVTKELQQNSNIEFSYFEILEQDSHPVYTYKLREGISDVRLGMYIINKENLIEIINDANN
jgi:DNA mismatch repair ATPase MutS